LQPGPMQRPKIYIYILLATHRRVSRRKAQAKNSIKKAQAKAQATRGEKLLARDKRRDFVRNNFVLL